NKLNEGDKEGFLKYLNKSIVTICLFLVPITFGVMFLSNDIVRVIYERGKFESNAVILTSMALFGYSIQLPFAGVRDILNSSLFSMKKTKVTTINGVIGVIVNIILSITLSKFFGVLGISIATSVSAIIIALLLLNSTSKIIGTFDVKELLIKVIKIFISSVIMIITLYYLNKFLVIESSFFIIILDGIIGAIIFFALCKIFRIEEFEEALNIVKNKLIGRES
ncbi:MAG: murein biosynthesis integral membrane protein MurJ, partial [Clostridium sp.]